jgi:hypothetical protein
MDSSEEGLLKIASRHISLYITVIGTPGNSACTISARRTAGPACADVSVLSTPRNYEESHHRSAADRRVPEADTVCLDIKDHWNG